MIGEGLGQVQRPSFAWGGRLTPFTGSHPSDLRYTWRFLVALSYLRLAIQTLKDDEPRAFDSQFETDLNCIGSQLQIYESGDIQTRTKTSTQPS